MKVLHNERFVWPADRPELPAKNKEVMKMVVKFLGGNPADWNNYILVDDAVEYPIDILMPSGTFIIKLRDGIPFTWPKRQRSRDHSDDFVVKTALMLKKLNPELVPYYFVSATANGLSLEYEGDGSVHPGQQYFLRVI